MDKGDIEKIWQSMNEATGESKPLPQAEVIESLLAFDADEMARFESGDMFYASDVCAYCQHYSGYGQVWCGNCDRGGKL